MTSDKTIHQGPFWIDPYDNSIPFPPVELALRDPDGLLALGGNLSTERLLDAYQQGIFPWYSDDQPVMWWSPDPRTVLFPEKLHISHSLQKTLNRNTYKVTLDTAFREVIEACAEPRKHESGTWITQDMIDAYCTLHESGYAHSVESWQDGKLAGGLYGVALGRVFFGESMFSRCSDASKVAFTTLVQYLEQQEFKMIDCQIHSAHLESLGAEQIPRNTFIDFLKQYCHLPCVSSPWQLTTDC